jgi:pimeloyl-ACP methyl ester carboxylesterase
MRSSVVSRGHRISYRAEGNGVPLVLLCGWTRWADTWWDAGYVNGLSNDYRVIAVDRLGHGDSDKPHDPAEYLEHLIVSDIVAVLDAEQVHRALVWGFSMGARNAASLAVMEPTRVAALVCGGGGPLPGSDGRRERVLAFADLVKTVDGMTTWLRSIGTPDEAVAESLARNDSAAVSATMAGAAEWIPAADEVRAPSLWYMGSDDEGGFTAEELELATRLRVETHVLPGADHVASFRRASDVLSIVRPFLDQHRVMT